MPDDNKQNPEENRTPRPDEPVVPDDYNPTHDKDYPHDKADVAGPPQMDGGGKMRYEDDLRDAEGRDVGERRPGEFILPDDDNVTSDWTLPTREGGGWDKALDKPLEEQIDEPDSPDKRNLR